jgi:pimeloyl-ACP methyl ester carboxylesterase
VAIELAVRFPTRIRSLTLYEPVRFSMLKKFGDPEWHEIADVASSMLKLALSGSHDASSERFVDYWSGAGTWAKLPDPARQAVRLRTAKVCAEFEALFSDEISLDQIGQLSMPVRLLSGTQSPRPVLRVVDRLADVLPGAKRIRLPGLGHMGPLLDPARVMDATGLFA